MLQKKNGLPVKAHGYHVPFAIRKDMRRQDVGIFIQNWFPLGSSSVRRTYSAERLQREMKMLRRREAKFFLSRKVLTQAA